MAVQYPVIGNWFRRPNGTLFEVVAICGAPGCEAELVTGAEAVDLLRPSYRAS